MLMQRAQGTVTGTEQEYPSAIITNPPDPSRFRPQNRPVESELHGLDVHRLDQDSVFGSHLRTAFVEVRHTLVSMRRGSMHPEPVHPDRTG